MPKRKRKKLKISDDTVEISMTPMIDVVFQLLIYFVVTFEVQDVIAHLDVFRPSPEAQAERPETPPKMIRIEIFPDGFTINDRIVDLVELDRLMGKLASIDTTQTILIMVTSIAPHGALIEVLDLCAKAGLSNLSVVSTE